MNSNNSMNLIIIILIMTIIYYLTIKQKNSYNNDEYNNKLKLLNEMIKISKQQIHHKIKSKEHDSQDQTIIQIQQQPQQLPLPIQPIPLMRDIVVDRDRAVLSDQLYPPLARTERPIFDSLVNMQMSGQFNYPTRGSMDTYRIVAYLVNSENKHDTWKLFGRQKFPGSSIGDFYAIPIDDRKSDMKITIKDDMMPKDKIRDIYALPSEVNIKSPLFNSSSYKIIELDKADLTSQYL